MKTSVWHRLLMVWGARIESNGRWHVPLNPLKKKSGSSLLSESKHDLKSVFQFHTPRQVAEQLYRYFRRAAIEKAYKTFAPGEASVKKAELAEKSLAQLCQEIVTQLHTDKVEVDKCPYCQLGMAGMPSLITQSMAQEIQSQSQHKTTETSQISSKLQESKVSTHPLASETDLRFTELWKAMSPTTSKKMEKQMQGPLWYCPQCTTVQSIQNRNCMNCQAPYHTPEIWPCKACTCDNPGNLLNCDACGARRDQPQEQEQVQEQQQYQPLRLQQEQVQEEIEGKKQSDEEIFQMDDVKEVRFNVKIKHIPKHFKWIAVRQKLKIVHFFVADFDGV